MASSKTQSNKTQSTNGSKERKTLDLTNLPVELTSRAREIWLAGLGALARLEEEGDKVFRTLVERGASYEKKRRKQFDEATGSLRKQQESFTKDVTKQFEEAAESVEKMMSTTLNETFSRLGIPTQGEVKDLSAKVGDLSAKLDKLSQALDAQDVAADTVTLHVVPHADGWAVRQEGADAPVSTHETKKEAVSAGREAAKAHAPSELIVHKQDRSVQETFSYDETDA